MQAYRFSRSVFPTLLMVGALGCSGDPAPPGKGPSSAGSARQSVAETGEKKSVEAKVVAYPEFVQEISRHRGKVIVVDVWALY